MTRRIEAPWYYLLWRPSPMDAETEIAMTRLIRKRGILFMLRTFCAIVEAEEWRHVPMCLGFFVRQNYPGLILATCWIFSVPYSGSICIAWLVTLAFGIAKFLGWLGWLLNRWPPLATG